MPFRKNGEIVSSKKTVNDSDGWKTQTEWEGYQSLAGIEIVNGTVKLAEKEFPADGLIHRYKASEVSANDGDEVSTWNDQIGTVDLSGEGNYVASGYQGNPALSFNQGSTSLEGYGTPNNEWSTTWGSGDYTFVAIIEPRDLTPTGNPRNYVNDNRNGSQITHSLGDDSTAGILGFNDGDNWINVVDTQANTDETNLTIWSRDSAGATMTGNINGNEDTANITVNDYGSRPNRIADREPGNESDNYNGNIYEILIYDKALTAKEREQLENYSVENYGVSIA